MTVSLLLWETFRETVRHKCFNSLLLLQKTNGSGSRRSLCHRLESDGGQPGFDRWTGGDPGLHREAQTSVEPHSRKSPRLTGGCDAERRSGLPDAPPVKYQVTVACLITFADTAGSIWTFLCIFSAVIRRWSRRFISNYEELVKLIEDRCVLYQSSINPGKWKIIVFFE